MESNQKNLAKKNRMEDRVEFLSAVDPSKLTGPTEFTDVGVITYKQDYLNSYHSPKQFEYANIGLAVLCNDSPFVKSIVAEHELGACVTRSRLKH
jgi:hypothetical protein